MRLRKVIRAGVPQVEAKSDKGWHALNQVKGLEGFCTRFSVEGDLTIDILSVLKLDQSVLHELEARLVDENIVTESQTEMVLPFEPSSFRDFMLYEKHVIDASRGFTKRFMPRAHAISKLFEQTTGKPFGKFLPSPLWYKQPIYYFGNHLNFLTEGDEIAWPSYTEALDYELELGIILAHPLFNATSAEAEKAIGGFVVLNDVSARDQQLAEMNSGFGPQLAKHFVNCMSAEVITADELLPKIDSLRGSVSINGVDVASCDGANMQYGLGESLAFLSRDVQLHSGELFGTGTLPGGSGIETGHWLKEGDLLTLSINGVGALTNTIGCR